VRPDRQRPARDPNETRAINKAAVLYENIHIVTALLVFVAATPWIPEANRPPMQPTLLFRQPEVQKRAAGESEQP
jgi:hypothetical protein